MLVLYLHVLPVKVKFIQWVTVTYPLHYVYGQILTNIQICTAG